VGKRKLPARSDKPEIDNEFLDDSVDLVVLLSRPIVVRRQITIGSGFLYHDLCNGPPAAMSDMWPLILLPHQR
jgi:hypothetical protein